MSSVQEILGPVLVIAAHPDDIEVHCGGTVAQLVAAGKQVTCVLGTSGNRGTSDPEVTMEQLARVREQEQRAASTALGVRDLRFFRHDDGDLQFAVPQLREEVVRLIREVRPQSIITHDPYPGDGGLDSCSIYPDHITVGRVVFESAFVCSPGTLFYPEHIQEGLRPHKPSVIYLIMSQSPGFFVDVSPVWEVKLRALHCHRSQGRHLPENDRETRRIAQDLGRKAGVQLAEAFRILRPS